MLKKGS